MLPSQLQPGDFSRYPQEARAKTTADIALLRRMPAIFVPILLRELIGYDWRFPTEKRELDDQVSYLTSLTDEALSSTLAGFAGIQLADNLTKIDWINSPEVFVEQLTSSLWASGQMDTFRGAANQYARLWREAMPSPEPTVPRLGIVILGRGVTTNQYPLFKKLRSQGAYFTQVSPDGGLSTLLDVVTDRASANPAPYEHWYIDGADIAPTKAGHGITQVSYAELEPVRLALLERMQRMIQSGDAGPEALRTMLAQIKPQDLDLPAEGDYATLSRFKISVLTEGSGTQIFSTTFAQWTAREALRRAQPSTLLVRFAPRRKQQPMNEMISGSHVATEPDPEGSLIDADMGAYYTWLNQQRLPGASKAKFLVWFEDHSEALAIGPTLPRGTVSTTPTDLGHILNWL
jgi:hypothetical protein